MKLLITVLVLLASSASAQIRPDDTSEVLLRGRIIAPNRKTIIVIDTVKDAAGNIIFPRQSDPGGTDTAYQVYAPLRKVNPGGEGGAGARYDIMWGGDDSTRISATERASLFFPLTKVLRSYSRQPSEAGTALSYINMPAMSIAGSVASDSTDCPWTLYYTTTNKGYYGGNMVFTAADTCIVRTSWNPIAEWTIRTTSTPLDSIGFLIGFTTSRSTGGAQWTVAQCYALFRYFTQWDGTAYWRCISNSGRTRESAQQDSTTTSVAVASGTRYNLKIALTSTSVQFFIDGNLVATHTVHIPPTSIGLNPISVVTNRTSIQNKSLKISKCVILHD